jgi:hypothetical protein
MQKVTNCTARPFVLPCGTVIPARGEAQVEAVDTNLAAVKAWLRAGLIQVEDVPLFIRPVRRRRRTATADE